MVLRDVDRAAKAHTEAWDPLAGQTYEYTSEQVFVYSAGAFDDCPATRPTSPPTSAAGAASSGAEKIAAVEWGVGTLVVALLVVGIVGGGAATVVIAQRKKRQSEMVEAPPLLPGGVVKSTSPTGSNGNRNRIVSSYDSQRMW